MTLSKNLLSDQEKFYSMYVRIMKILKDIKVNTPDEAREELIERKKAVPNKIHVVRKARTGFYVKTISYSEFMDQVRSRIYSPKPYGYNVKSAS